MRALLLCAGLGERLRPLTDACAKPALPLGDGPLAARPLRRLASAGVREVAANLHHLPGTVKAALGDGSRWGVSIRYVEEPEILGTGGAVRNVRAWLMEEGTALVANADTLAEADLTQAVVDHRVSLAAATAVVEDLDPRPEFSAVWADAEERLTGFGQTGAGRPYHFAGFHILEPGFLEALPDRKRFCLHREGYLPFLSAGGRARVWAGATGVRDLGTPERYREALGA